MNRGSRFLLIAMSSAFTICVLGVVANMVYYLGSVYFAPQNIRERTEQQYRLQQNPWGGRNPRYAAFLCISFLPHGRKSSERLSLSSSGSSLTSFLFRKKFSFFPHHL